MRGGSRLASRRPEGRRRGRRKRARRIGAVIDHVLEELSLGSVVEQHTVFREWESRVGSEIARAAQPHRLDGSTLIVHVENPAWMNELSLRQGDVLERLNRGRKKTRIDRLILRLDPGTRG